MATIVDARGFSCPQPVIMTRKAIQAGEFPIEVLVPSPRAKTCGAWPKRLASRCASRRWGTNSNWRSPS